METGHLFVLSGPSGAGKGTICDKVVKDGCADLSISMTTRAIRGNEIPNVSYYYVSDEEFDKTIEDGGFLEYAGIYGHRYGTPKKPVLDAMEKGRDVILEIEMQGAEKVKVNYPDTVRVFVLPPSLKELEFRLKNRNSDSPEQIEERTKAVLGEIKKIVNYDYYVVNDDLDTAVSIVKNIILAEHGDEDAKVIADLNRVAGKVQDIIDMYEEEAKNNAFISIN